MNLSIEWLLESDEPWTRYRTRLDLLGQSPDSAEVCADRQRLLKHPLVQRLIDKAQHWGDQPLKRHNDAGHPLYALSTLADFGLRASDPGLASVSRP